MERTGKAMRGRQIAEESPPRQQNHSPGFPADKPMSGVGAAFAFRLDITARALCLALLRFPLRRIKMLAVLFAQ